MSEENAPEASQENAPEASQENAPEAEEVDNTMPSAGKQIMVMGLIVVGITVVLGGGVWLSMILK